MTTVSIHDDSAWVPAKRNMNTQRRPAHQPVAIPAFDYVSVTQAGIADDGIRCRGAY